MKTEPVKLKNSSDFINYCKTYAKEHDESFVPPDDYKPRTDEPAFLLTDENGLVQGAAALMLHKEYTDISRARFRIFHCIVQNIMNYELLLNEIVQNAGKIDYIFCYITDEKRITREIWEKLGFSVWRYSWVLEKDITNIIPAGFPPGFELHTMREGTDETAWCCIINEAFNDIAGHTHLTPGKMDEWKKEKDYFSGGMKLLWDTDSGKPAGLIALSINEEENGRVFFIQTIALLKKYRGMGLGKNLLRYGVETGGKLNFKKAALSVNAENSKAADLYLKEGFKIAEIYLCYHKKIN